MIEPTTPTIAEYAQYWLDLRKRDLAENTHARYRTLVRNQVIPYIGSTRLAELNAASLERLYEQLALNGSASGNPLRTATIGQVHRFLHVCLEFAIAEGVLRHNPVDRVKSPRVASLPQATLRYREGSS